MSKNTSIYEYNEGINYVNYLSNQYLSLNEENKKNNIENKIFADFSTIKKRILLAKKIDKKFKEINFTKGSTQCVRDQILKHNFYEKMLGCGSFGSVVLANLKYTDIRYAIKETRPTKDKKIKLRDITSNDIIEIKYLFNEINPLIEKKKTPGLPYTYSYFLCNDCNIIIQGSKKRQKFKCGVLCAELCTGEITTLSYLNESKSTNEIDDILFNIYFQLMYSLAVVHYYTGIQHRDIKDSNILYYTVTKGGYWKYIIGNEIFYLPNLGFVVIINDFGVSEYVYPYKLKENTNRYNRLHYGIIDKNNDFIITIPKMKINKEYIKNDIENYNKYLEQFNINIKTLTPKTYISPLYAYDVMDTIYLFCGGKQTAQNGKHDGIKIYKKSNIFKKTIKELLTINKTTKNENWKNTNSSICNRLNNNTLKKYENPLYISALSNLLYIYSNKYKEPPVNEKLLEIYNFY